MIQFFFPACVEYIFTPILQLKVGFILLKLEVFPVILDGFCSQFPGQFCHLALHIFVAKKEGKSL